MVTFQECCSVRVYGEDEHMDTEEALKEGPDPVTERLRLLLKHVTKVKKMSKRQVASFVGEALMPGVHARLQLVLERLSVSEATSVGSHLVRASCEPLVSFLWNATQ